jgi:hypothetical protein
MLPMSGARIAPVIFERAPAIWRRSRYPISALPLNVLAHRLRLVLQITSGSRSDY